MKHTTKSRRTKALALGALLVSVVSISAVSDTASAAKLEAKTDSSVTLETDVSRLAMLGGIRW